MPSFMPFLRRLALLLLLPASQAHAQHPIIQRIHDTADPKQDSVFQLGSTITLEVTGLNRWLQVQEQVLVQRGFTVPKAHEMARDLVLYIDDAPLIGMPPLAVYANEATPPPRAATQATAPALSAVAGAAGALLASSDSASLPAASTPPGPDSVMALLADHPAGVADKVMFRLRRDISNYRYWNVVYNSPWDFSHPSKVGLGYADRVFTELYPSNAGTIRLILIQPLWLWFAGVCILLLAAGLVLLATRSWLLRDTDGSDDGNPSTPLPTLNEANPPYSLAKLQLAWWTFIILSSYFVIYCATGIMADISTTSLALLGISAGTTALSGLISPGATITASPAATTPAAPSGQLPTALVASRGWVRDILSDEHGISIHRLQKVVIALIMGGFFVRSVYLTVAMPVWTTNQTLLLAISSATYLGLKWQENRVSTANTIVGAAASIVPPFMPPAPDPYANGLNSYSSNNYNPLSTQAGYSPLLAPNGYANPATPASYAGTAANPYYPVATPALGMAGNAAASSAVLSAALAGGAVVPYTTPPAGPASLVPSPEGALPAAPGGLGSLADPVTGAVIWRQEDDMGPDSAAEGFVPSQPETEQLPG